jgi:hypothetical protein
LGEADRRHDTRGVTVRVVEYTHDDPNRPGAGERHRRITDLVLAHYVVWCGG